MNTYFKSIVMTRTASTDTGKNHKYINYIYINVFYYSRKPVKHRRHECLKQFPLKPSLTLSCPSKTVTFPEKLQEGGKPEPPVGSLKEFRRSHFRSWKRGQTE